MKRWRLIQLVHDKKTYYRIERRILFFFWIDIRERDFGEDELHAARARFIQVVANHGPRVVLAEM